MNVLAFVRGCSEAPYHRQEDDEVASQRLKTRVTGHSHVNSNASTAAHRSRSSDIHDDNNCRALALCQHPKPQKLELLEAETLALRRPVCALFAQKVVPVSNSVSQVVPSSPSWKTCSKSSAGTGFGEACDPINVQPQMHKAQRLRHVTTQPPSGAHAAQQKEPGHRLSTHAK